MTDHFEPKNIEDMNLSHISSVDNDRHRRRMAGPRTPGMSDCSFDIQQKGTRSTTNSVSPESFCDDQYDPEYAAKKSVNITYGDILTAVSVAGAQNITQACDGKGNSDPLGINANLILGMERTFFSSLNNAWLLAMGGVGLMSVGNDQVSNNAGVAMLSASMMLVCLAFMFHIHRAQQIQYGISTNWFLHTKSWATIVCFLTVMILTMEIYYAKRYPYLDRSWAVKVEGAADETNR